MKGVDQGREHGAYAKHSEHHTVDRLGWLRAAVLGANDGILSTSSLIIGVATATNQNILIAGFAGLTAGAMSMAAGEYVSVSSQSDSEDADLSRERRELTENLEGELKELAGIYGKRGLDRALALQVTKQFMDRDARHMHEMNWGFLKRTLHAWFKQHWVSAASFSVGGCVPLIVALATSVRLVPFFVAVASLVFLAVLGVVGAKLGGAKVLKAAIRVTFWGAFAMVVTAAISLVPTVVPSTTTA